jgi:hypothetical protein
VDFSIFHPHGNRAQMLAAAGTSHAKAIRLIEGGAVHGADQRVVLQQKLARGIIQPARRMRTNVEIGLHLLTTPQQNDTLLAVSQHRVDGSGATIGNLIQPA